MRLEEIIQQHAKVLPPALEAAVFNFVLFLEQKQANNLLISDQLQRKKQLKKALDNAVELRIFGYQLKAGQFQRRRKAQGERLSLRG